MNQVTPDLNDPSDSEQAKRNMWVSAWNIDYDYRQKIFAF